MIQIAIVEDDEAYVETLKGYLRRFEEETGTRFKTTVFYDGEDIIQDYSQAFDIIFMDIEMDCINGMKAAQEIRKTDEEVIIMFVTNMTQYAMEGYKVDALDYILKPIGYYAFSQRLEKALKRISRRQGSSITIAVSNGVRRLELSRIFYIEVQNHDSIFHTRDGIFTTKDSLKNIEANLKDSRFFRCHKWFLVNLEHIQSISDSDIHVGTMVIQVSRARKKEILDALNRYLNEAGK